MIHLWVGLTVVLNVTLFFLIMAVSNDWGCPK